MTIECLQGSVGYQTEFKPSEFMQEVFEDRYRNGYPNNPSINGKVFEFCVAECLLQMGISPFYYQASLLFVPNVDFDFVCYHPIKPVVLSCKTSLRERWKQADLEAIAIKQVYRQAKNHLLTSSSEAKPLQAKLRDGNISGLDSCIMVQEPEFDDLLNQLKLQDFVKAKMRSPIENGHLFPASNI